MPPSGNVNPMVLSVILPTHNPNVDRLKATLAALLAQTLPANQWELLIVDNASTKWPDEKLWPETSAVSCTIVREPKLGLSSARRAGFLHACGSLFVLVDDDNVLGPNYLSTAVEILDQRRDIGLAGGKVVPQFTTLPPRWAREFYPLLALRDLGDQEIVSAPPDSMRPDDVRYPRCAPLGAGMVGRIAAVQPWLSRDSALSDRRGAALSSAGDNDIVLCALGAGWQVGYFPRLTLTHLIPDERLAPDYLARLNHGVQRSWVQVLAVHNASPWPTIPGWTVRLRCMRLWWRYRAWRGHAECIRWHGACGNVEGRSVRLPL